MKKCLVLVLAMVLAGLMCCGAYAAEYWEEGNDGDSWETAYVIDSVEDFMLMRQRSGSRSGRNTESGKYYRLTTNLDLSSVSGISGASLYGHLDGQNHTIKVNITDENEYWTTSIFSLVSSDSVAIRNLNVSGNIYSKGQQAAGIVQILGAGSIENCSFTGTITADNDANVAGGIVGIVNNATVRNCTFSGNITVSGQSTATAGGIAASVMGGSIENCTVLSGTTITCNTQQSTMNVNRGSAGGIAGQATTVLKASSITNCTSYATLDGNASWKGGIVGSTSDSEYNYMMGVQNTILSGNTWQEDAYPEVGNSSLPGNLSDDVIRDNLVSGDTSTTTELPIGVIEPVTPSEDVMENLASLVSTDTSALHLITQENISSPQEPTQTIKQYIHDDGYEAAYKLNTLTVSEDGYYVFLVNIPDEFVGKKVSDIKIYALKNADFASSFFGLINGVLNYGEITNLLGVKIDTLEKQVLAVGILQAGTPFSVYLAKILLALLAGGCNSGIGVMPGIFMLALISLPFLRKL